MTLPLHHSHHVRLNSFCLRLHFRRLQMYSKRRKQDKVIRNLRNTKASKGHKGWDFFAKKKYCGSTFSNSDFKIKVIKKQSCCRLEIQKVCIIILMRIAIRLGTNRFESPGKSVVFYKVWYVMINGFNFANPFVPSLSASLCQNWKSVNASKIGYFSWFTGLTGSPGSTMHAAVVSRNIQQQRVIIFQCWRRTS